MINIFKKIINHKAKVLLGAIIIIPFLIYHATKLEIDASAETLLINGDKDLEFSRYVNKQYNNKEFLIVTYSNENLLSESSLTNLNNLINELKGLQYINKVTSILNVPLLESPIIPINELVNGAPTIESIIYKNKSIKDIWLSLNINEVKNEFLTSELYKNSLVSKDLKTTSIILYLNKNEKYFEFLNHRNQILNLENKTIENKKELIEIEKNFKQYRNEYRKYETENIKNIRAILSKYNKEDSKLFLGGINMIANDVILFIKSDLIIYGSSLFLILGLLLYYIFKSIRWVLLSLLICIVSVVTTSGLFSLLDLEITVISSNFIALQLILTLSIIIHLIVRYRELYFKYNKSNQYKLVLNTILSKYYSSVFATLTTIVGFASLSVSNILPVKNLGIMMSIGVIISLIVAFILFIIFTMFIGKKEERLSFNKSEVIKISLNILFKKQKLIILITIICLISFIYGSKNLIVENSFINYFKQNTEIYKSMKIIDEELGGTTPLDIIIKFKDIKIEDKNNLNEFDEFETNDDEYWFTEDKLNVIKNVHKYLESLPEIGKIDSFEKLLRVGKTLNENKDLDSLTLAIFYKKIPEEYKDLVITPYLNIPNNEIRFNLRIKDSIKDLRRNELLKKIDNDLKKILENKAEHKLTGLMVLYNNMLQSLFETQIKTITYTLGLLFIMFIITFRSIKYSIIALTTNIIPICTIFGIMGIFGIPLDIMTITIAAISIGIGVDDTIHYIHRFKEELKKDNNIKESIIRSHNSIGFAMYFTTVIIIFGFGILLLSNLIPTIYFSLLIILVMILMLTSSLILLPYLLIKINMVKIKYK